MSDTRNYASYCHDITVVDVIVVGCQNLFKKNCTTIKPDAIEVLPEFMKKL